MKQLVEVFAEIVAATQAEVLAQLQEADADITTIHYEHGHYAEINQTLQEFNESRTYYTKKYPLVALIEDVQGRIVATSADTSYTFNLIICFTTLSDSKSQKRYDEVINPILQVIYEALKRNIMASGYFYGYFMPHDPYIHPFYGSQDRKDVNVFNDFLDCIEMRNCKLKMYPQDECAWT